MTEKTIIKILRKAIPKMKCKITCNDCCGPIPFSKWEWNQIKDKKYASSLTCPYSSLLGCKIYNDRPIMCRLFGTSEDKRIKCPHGYIAKNTLTIKKSKQIAKIYHKIIIKSLNI